MTISSKTYRSVFIRNFPLLATAIATMAFAIHCQAQADTTSQFGNFNLSFNNLGVLFSDVTDDSHGFEAPAGSGRHTMYASRIWIGGLDDSLQLHLSGGKFGGNISDFSAGPLDSNGNSDSTLQANYNFIWLANKPELNNHLLYFESLYQGTTSALFPDGYNIPEWILTWPGNNSGNLCNGTAPYSDYNANGFYDPENGDYPCFRGDKCAYIIYNDNGGVHNETNGVPLKVTCHVMVYSFDNVSYAVSNSVFVNCKIYNCSEAQYHDTYLGVWTDLDIGVPYDDYIGCNVRNAFYYSYNADALDSSTTTMVGYDLNTPIQTVAFLGGPYFDSDGLDNAMPKSFSGYTTYGPYGPGFNDGIIDNEQIGMSSFIYHNAASNPINGDPLMPNDYYNYMRANWRTGSPLLHGGNGVTTADTTTLQTSYAYPHTSDPLMIGTQGNDVSLWNEMIAGNTPQDRRAVGGCGPFTFDPGEELNLDLAYIFCDETGSGLSEFYYAELQVEQVRNFFFNNGLSCTNITAPIKVDEYSELNNVIAFPNPTSGDLHLRLSTSQKGEYSLLDISGRTVQNGNLDFKSTINMTDLSPGEYFLMIKNTDGETLLMKRIQKFN